VQDIVAVVTSEKRPWHAALIGAGGIGKSSIAKAVLNDSTIAEIFTVRVYVTYDDIASTAMTFQLFLEHISDALALTGAEVSDIRRFLKSTSALLVIDNAETFRDAGDDDGKKIMKALNEIGAQQSTRIIITSRNSEVVPQNLRCKRFNVSGLSMDASCDAFEAVYDLEPIDNSIRGILGQLEYHPLSINLLASAAAMNEWTISKICQVWEQEQVQVLTMLDVDDKYRNLRTALEISIVAFKQSSKELVMQILRAIAFLPQGIHLEAFEPIFPSVHNISFRVDEVKRSSLIYQKENRFTMLAPIRMYIADRYNPDLPYDDNVLSCIRGYYHSNLSYAADDFVEREHGNIDRLMHFDMISPHYQSDIKIHSIVLDKAEDFLFCTTVQLTSLWQLLVAEIHVNSFSKVDSLAHSTSLCLAQICWIAYNRNDYDEALGKLKATEAYCRNHSPVCNEQLVRCLQLKSYIFQSRGNLPFAIKALEEGSSIARALNHILLEALLNNSLADVLLLQGKITDASSLYLSAQQYFEAKNEYSYLTTLLIDRSYVFISQNDFPNGRLLLDKAMELDQSHNGGRLRLYILSWKASCEGWAGDVATALKILQEATEVEVSSGTAHFEDYLGAMQGRAYYEARMGRITDARNSIARAIALKGESGGDWGDDFISALIANFARERGKAIFMIRTILNQYSADDRQIMAVSHCTLAEILLIEGRDIDGRAQFAQAKAICDETGISPKHLYVNREHWFSLPVKYDGWVRFLADTL